jgi:hypothetical protein
MFLTVPSLAACPGAISRAPRPAEAIRLLLDMHHAYWLAAVGLLFAVLLAKFTPEGRRPVIYRKVSA